MTAFPHVIALGTAVPPRRYAQEELAELFTLREPRLRRLFQSSHIQHRHLVLPDPGPDGMPDEPMDVLLAKHKAACLEVGGQAIARCLASAALTVQDIDFLICVTSTGYLCPGLSAWYLKELGFRDDVHRTDIVGMGCNAALNALQNAAGLARAYPGANILVVCCEICSAAYVPTRNIEHAVVNSLFGAAAAAVLRRGLVEGSAPPLTAPVEPAAGATAGPPACPALLDFESLTITDAIDTMRFRLEDQRLSFFLDRDIPYVIGAHCDKPVSRLLARHGLKRRHVQHWVIHSGGKKVVDSIKMNLELSDHDVRHTLDVLSGFGNISSCACLFSLLRLCSEGVVRPGDRGVLMAMGPGAAIETALLQW